MKQSYGFLLSLNLAVEFKQPVQCSKDFFI